MNQLLEVGRAQRLPVARLADCDPTPQALSLLTLEQARKHTCLPLAFSQQRLLVACKPDQAIQLSDFLSRLVGCEVAPVLAEESALADAITRAYVDGGISSQYLRARALKSVNGNNRGQESSRGPSLPQEEAPVARWVTHLLTRAVRLRASDIHLEPAEPLPVLRYRIDGALHQQDAIPKEIYPAMVARIKILSDLDIAERRRAQDGRAVLEVDGKRVELRISTMPMLDGEGVVIRLLGAGGGPTDLCDLCLPEKIEKEWLQLARLPHGMLLVTGPTGSGKTTTLYSTLRAIEDSTRKFITLEEPVEARLDGVSQIPVRSELGFTFAQALRSVLRHDPDVLLVGEIRDAESASIALQASLTGHLLFATLHTNSAAQAVTRLLDMGLASYQVTTALAGVLAQRLLRKLCPVCKIPVEHKASELPIDWPGEADEVVELAEARGCESCSGIGYQGRIAVFELLVVTAEMRRLKPAQFTPEKLQELARTTGFTTMKEAGMAHLRDGTTSLKEYCSVFGKEGDS